MRLACCQPAQSQAEMVNQQPPSHLSPRWLAEEAGLPKSAPSQAGRGDKHCQLRSVHAGRTGQMLQLLAAAGAGEILKAGAGTV